jgi:hypothetical protein
MAPPKIAKDFMKCDWAGSWFDDDSNATEVLLHTLCLLVT